MDYQLFPCTPIVNPSDFKRHQLVVSPFSEEVLVEGPNKVMKRGRRCAGRDNFVGVGYVGEYSKGLEEGKLETDVRVCRVVVVQLLELL